MYFSPRLLTVTALASISLFSSLKGGSCDTIVPLKSIDDVSVFVDGTVIPTQLHVVDPWIRPPRGVETQQAHGLPGDFDLYPKITVTPFDRIKFNMRPIAREGSNTQRHGVYVITEKQIVRDFLDGKSDHPCGEPVYTEDDLCQVVEYQGLNATNCPARETLFPLLEIFGSSGEIEYTVSGLAALAESYGVETETGSKVLAFDCPWIQGRNTEGSGSTSHCIGGMYLIAEVVVPEAVIESTDTSDGSKHLMLSLSYWATIMVAFIMC
jgi:hypothetical protein